MNKLFKIVFFVFLISTIFVNQSYADKFGFDEYEAGMKYEENQELSVALKYFLLAAEKGNVIAMNKLATYYEFGFGTDKNPKAAFNWSKKASDLGSKEAFFQLAKYYQKGIGTPKNDTLAFQSFKKSAESGYVEAYYFLAWQYRLGKGTPENDKEALKWFIKAYEYAGSEDQIVLGISAHHIGMIFYDGKGVDHDSAKAVKWLKLALKYRKNNYDAPFLLANICFENGEFKEAMDYYMLSAQRSRELFTPVLLKIGDMYLYGHGMDKPDKLRACDWYIKAADKYDEKSYYRGDSEEAMLKIGRIYLDGGENIPRDLEKARLWLKKAADVGNLKAILLLDELNNLPQN